MLRLGAVGSHPTGAFSWAQGALVADGEPSQVAAEVVERLTVAGVPQGYWLVRIEQALVSTRATEALLHDLLDAIIDECARDSPATLALARQAGRGRAPTDRGDA